MICTYSLPNEAHQLEIPKLKLPAASSIVVGLEF
jgi:hypothetical protein